MSTSSQVIIMRHTTTTVLSWIGIISVCLGMQARGDEKRIDISSMMTTSPQDGMLRVTDEIPENGDRINVSSRGYLRQILQNVTGNSSNVFLVDATTPHDAVNASWSVFIGPFSGSTAATVNTADPVRGSHWLVAYLGTAGSEPSYWIVDKATINGRTIRLTYRIRDPGPETRDSHRYYYWVPLGTLKPDTYKVELYDAGLEEVTLMRRVEVEKPR